MAAQHRGRKGRPWRRRWEMFRRQCERDNLPCAHPDCGRPIDYRLRKPHPEAFTADHIIPWSKLDVNDRRRDSLSNLQPMHARCNSSKNDRDLSEKSLPPPDEDATPWEW